MDKCKGLGDLRSIHKRNMTLSLISFPTLFTSSCWIFFSFWNWCKVVKVSSWFHESFILSFANKTFDDIFSEVDKVREISVCGELSVQIEGTCKKHFEDMYLCFLIPPQGLSEAWMVRKHLIATICTGHWIIVILHHARFLFFVASLICNSRHLWNMSVGYHQNVSLIFPLCNGHISLRFPSPFALL